MDMRLPVSFLCAALLGGLSVRPAGAQSLVPAAPAPPVSDDDLRQGVLSGDVALVPLAEVTVADSGRSVSVSPTKNYALIARRSTVEVRAVGDKRSFRPPVRSTEELVVWGPSSRQPTTLWQREIGTTLWDGSAIVIKLWRIGEYTDARIDSMVWFAGTNIALITVRIGPTLPASDEQFSFSFLDTADSPKAKTLVLRVDAARGTVEELALLDVNKPMLYVSEVEPVAALLTEDGKNVMRLASTGPATEWHPVVLGDGRAVRFYRALSLSGGRWFGYPHEDDSKSANGNPSRRFVTVDSATGIVRDYDKSKEGKRIIIPEAVLPYRLFRATGEVPFSTLPVGPRPLWMDSLDVRETERGLICVEPAKEYYGLNDAVLYYRDEGLFAKPLLTLPRATFLARSRPVFKSDTLERARAIQAAARRYAQTHQGRLPPPDAFVRGMRPLVASVDVFDDPATELPGFTVVYRKAQRAPAARLILGYLTCPGGRAVVYFAGEPGWEDAPMAARP